MPIDGISGIPSLTPLQSVQGKPNAAGDTEFADILSSALANADSTDAVSQANTQALLTGNVDDVAGTVVDLEKADVALRLTIQVRNKILDAYNEVMRMQV